MDAIDVDCAIAPDQNKSNMPRKRKAHVFYDQIFEEDLKKFELVLQRQVFDVSNHNVDDLPEILTEVSKQDNSDLEWLLIAIKTLRNLDKFSEAFNTLQCESLANVPKMLLIEECPQEVVCDSFLDAIPYTAPLRAVENLVAVGKAIRLDKLFENLPTSNETDSIVGVDLAKTVIKNASGVIGEVIDGADRENIGEVVGGAVGAAIGGTVGVVLGRAVGGFVVNTITKKKE